jgi:hypothetical protein
MPYIKQERRDAMAHTLLPKPDDPQNAGELNYAITILLLNYWHSKGHSYQTINDIVGACCGAVHEFQRRIVGKYEDQKIKENGDVYGQ